MRYGLSFVLVLWPASLACQPATDRHDFSVDASLAEMAVLNTATMLTPKSQIGTGRRGINPRYIATGIERPDLAGTAVRDASRNAQIVRAGFVVREPEEVCSAGGCVLNDLRAYISMSDPRIDGDHATVTLSILTATDRPNALQEELLVVQLTRSAGTWRVSSLRRSPSI